MAVDVDPAGTSVLPGGHRTYRIEGSNYGNNDDTITAASAILDSNTDGCTLTTLGSRRPGCPYRAEITRIPAAWLTPGTLPADFGTLVPLASSSSDVDIAVPGTWAGMEDTTYEITFKPRSAGNPDAESEVQVLQLTVRATRESMTRYIGLEIRSFIEEIERANRAGIRSGGLLPILIHPVETTNGRALQAILGRDFDSAARMHETMIQIMGGFVRQLEASSLPAALRADWMARAQAMVADLQRASTTTVTAGSAETKRRAPRPMSKGGVKTKR